ncbi:hypothetical protein AB4Y89_05195 [Terriglobus sp. 2YAB30_2]
MRITPFGRPMALAFAIACAVVFASTIATAQTWVHPGIVVSPQQLLATRTAYQNGDLTVGNQVNKAMASSYGSTTYAVQGYYPGGISQCGANSNPNHGCQAADNDSNAAYVQALLWYLTGNQTYANNAMNIMNAWASFQGYAGTNGLSCPSGTDCSNGPLQSGWDAEKWPRAAEILYYGRTSSGASSGWSSTGFTNFKNMLINVYQPVIQNGSGVNGNWDMSMIDGTMQIAVLTENRTLLNQARTMWLGRVPDLFYLNAIDGSSHAASPRGNPSWFGQSIFNSSTENVNQETCRDLTHTEDSISSTMMAAETDWIQGGELYTDTNNSSETGAQVKAEDRIVGALNLIAGLEAQNPGQNNIITAPFDFCTSSGGVGINQIKLGYGATYVIGYNAYHNRLNVAAMQNQHGSSGQHGTANTYNWIQNNGLNLAQDTDHGNHMTLFEALTHSTEVCTQANNSSWNSIAYIAQTGSPTVKFNATPSQNNANTVVGLSSGTPAAYAQLAAIVRFNPSGFIDAYNGNIGGYAAVNSIPYTGGTKYSFWMVLNIPNQTYDAYVTPDGGSQVQIASGYKFRLTDTTLDHAILHAEVGTDNVCSFNLPLGGNFPQ